MSDQERTLAWLNEALKLEERGRAGYRKAEAEAGDPLAKELFGRLAELEDDHVERFKEIFQQVSQHRHWPASARHKLPQALAQGALRSWFLKPLLKNKNRFKNADIEAAVQTGVDFEQASVAFYQDNLARAQGAAPGEREFLAAMAAEEQIHLEILNELKLYYTDPEAWSLQMDHALLDGA